jgi:hypothetical protein
MTLNEIKEFLRSKNSYLKCSPEVIANRLNCSNNDARVALTEIKNELKNVNTNSNDSEFEVFIDRTGIKPEEIRSVKFWQTQKGDARFSVVTANKSNNIEDLKLEIESFASQYSPVVVRRNYPKYNYSEVALEISLPDVHYGKMNDESNAELEDLYIATISSLVSKASHLPITKILLPIGNDGLNSEGLRQTTTKGTPQQDNMTWMESFRGYWGLLVKTINYLQTIAPVDVIVVSGNHDYERMFYIGDVLAGWYRNNENVSVDNSMHPRKYWEYGNAMLMFTHGDKEKASDLPLIMATEQPEMFAKSLFREAHCGHLHKEMVNEYRGIKVRFIPSICASDDWHKQMGYESKRSGQAFVWTIDKGLEGYFQVNI